MSVVSSVSTFETVVVPAGTATGPSFVGRWFWPTWSLARRELVRFFRQRSRLIGALIQPVLFWVLFGAGLHGSFRVASGTSYQEYFFPGVAVMIMLFTAIFSTISIIEDRREGFLQGVLAAPAPRLTIVLGKVLGGTTLALLQTLLFLACGPLLGWVGLAPPMTTGLTISNLLPVVGWLVVMGTSLTALGYCMAWPMESTQGFHALMSVVLMPMWLLSGAFFPAAETGWLSVVIRANPLTYGVAGLRRILVVDPALTADLPSWTVCGVATGLFCAVTLGGAVSLTLQRSVRNAR